MKIYLAGRYGRREELLGYAAKLGAEFGHEVTSRWLRGEHEASDGNPTPEQAEQWAEDDLADIARADMLVAFAEEPNSQHGRGGRHVEFGYALALGLVVVVVGQRENVFHNLGNVWHFDTFERFCESLGCYTIGGFYVDRFARRS